MSNERILFLLINYFNENEVAEFFYTQLGNYLTEGIEIIIIDNGSKDSKILKEIENKYSLVTVLNPEKNLGYFGAANFGISYYCKVNNDYPEALVICNTDISFESVNFINKLKKIMNEKEFDILGPDIYSSFLKYHQNPYILNRISSTRLKIFKFVTSNTLFYILFTMLHLIKAKIVKSSFKKKMDESMEIYAIHGSFMVFNKTYFTKGGTINYPSFLFGEELFIAETALKLKLRTIYEPSLIITHFQNTTTGIFKSRKSIAYLHQSYSYILKTFFTLYNNK